MKISIPTIVIASVIAAISFTGFSTGQDKFFAPTYQTGQSYEVVISSSVIMDMSAVGAAMGTPGAAGKTTVSTTMVMAIDAKEHTTPGQQAISSSFLKVAMNMDMGPMKMNYDSSDPSTAETPIAAAMKPLLEMDITTIIDEKGKAIEIKGLESMGAMQAFDADQLKQMMSPAAQLGIPAEGVSIGDTWDNVFDMPMGKQVGSISMKMKMTYIKDEMIGGVNCAVIDYVGAINMKIADNADTQALGMTMKAGEIKGTMKFDKKNKCFKEGNSTGKMTLSMQSPADPEKKLTLPMEVEQTTLMKLVK